MSAQEDLGQGIRVLLVEHDQDVARNLDGWLEAEGFDVYGCPGPTAPDYSCLGGRDEPCPLEAIADIIVLDMRQASDVVMRGLPGWQLALRYYEMGKKLVVLLDDDDPVRPSADDALSRVRRPVEKEPFLRAVREMVQRINNESRGRISRRVSLR